MQANLAASPAASAISGRAQLNAQEPIPRCEFPSVQRNISAAMSVEAVQQDGDDDDDVHGAVTFPTSSQAGATSMPSAHLPIRQHPSIINSRLPVTPVLHQLSPASAGRSQLEHRESVVFDNDSQVLASSPSSQQLFELPAYSSKRQRVDSNAGPRSARMDSPEGSNASQGHPQISVNLCQAAHNTSQQGALEEVHLQNQTAVVSFAVVYPSVIWWQSTYLCFAATAKLLAAIIIIVPDSVAVTTHKSCGIPKHACDLFRLFVRQSLYATAGSLRTAI